LGSTRWVEPLLPHNFEEDHMAMKSLSIGAACLVLILGATMAPRPTLADAPTASTVAKHDTDNDQTLDLAEVKTAAGAHFDRLDKDADGTLDANEVKGIIGPKAFKAADPDNDGTLTKDEYLALVEKLFKHVDTDKDGTLSVAELKSTAGRALKHLID
jgi:Ca2+-binding EF-hand superfamily protein